MADIFKDVLVDTTNYSPYFFIGKTGSWGTTNDVAPTPVDSVSETDLDIWNQMLSMKKIIPANITFVVPRINWVTGTVYTPYDAKTSQAGTNFYVITDELKIYKCIGNNNGGTSTTKPTSTATTIATTADGYRWKFMGELTTADAFNYLTTDYVPVKELLADDGSLQWDVQAAAVNGSIDSYKVTTVGSGYRGHTGFVNAATSTTVTLDTGASATNTHYLNSGIYISAGTGIGQYRKIQSYNGTTRVATLSTAWSTNPDGSSAYVVGPYVTVKGNGTGAAAYATVNGSNQVSSILPVSVGSGYTQASLSLSGSDGTGAVGYPNLSPVGGHGSNIIRELLSSHVLIKIIISSNEGGTFIEDNDIRQVGIVLNPRLASNNALATVSSYRVAPTMTIASMGTPFELDEVITGSTSTATCKMVESLSSTSIIVSEIDGKFTNGETLTAPSGRTTTLTTFNAGPIKTGSGDIMFIENRSSIQRSPDQQEEIRLVVKF